MASFDDREKGFESKYKLDEELRFKAMARRNKLLGLWAADLMGITGADADEYAKEVVKSDFEKPGDEDVLEKLLQDDQLPVPDVAANTAPEPETTAPDLAQLEALSPEQLPSEKAAPSVDRHVESDRIRSLLDDD